MQWNGYLEVNPCNQVHDKTITFEFQVLHWQTRSELLEIGSQKNKPEPS